MRFTQLFNHLKNQRVAKIPFLMLGDASLAIIKAVIHAGVDALELGFPFSDPIADGPIIQAAAARARKNGTTVVECFNIIQQIRLEFPELPIGILIYANLVYQYGLDAFYKQAKTVGIDAVLIPDVPTLEAHPYINAAKAHQVNPILMVTPTCTIDTMRQTAQLAEGYVYVVTRKGVTGIDKQSELTQAGQLVEQLNALNAPPPVFGFGIKNAIEIQHAADVGARGVIIGSALIDQLVGSALDEIGVITKRIFA